MKRGFFFGTGAVLIGITILLGSCSAVQVRDRAYLQAAEITDTSAVSVQLHDFEAPGTAASGTGNNLDSALQQASMSLGKELFFGHLELLAYSDPACTGQLSQWMDAYRLSPSCKILALTEPDSLTEEDTTQLTEQLRRGEESGILPETSLFSILRELAGSSGTALMPVWQENSFSAAVVTKDRFVSILSPQAAAGLCWLRGDNFPAQIAVSSTESYQVHHGSVRLTATQTGEFPQVTATIYLWGEGDFSKAAPVIEQQCEAAIAETLSASGADVFDLEACLRSQCYAYVEQTPPEALLQHVTCTVQVVNKGG